MRFIQKSIRAETLRDIHLCIHRLPHYDDVFDILWSRSDDLE